MEPSNLRTSALVELCRSRNACSSSGGPANCIVGRLQLCNSHQVMGILDQCLALSDECATVCCLIPCFQCGFLDQCVRVTVWNYFPGENRGVLEVLCMEPVQVACSATYAEKTFPTLCINPGAADTRDHVLESPLVKVGTKKSARIAIQGLLMSIGSPFLLPRGNRAGQGSVEEEAEAVDHPCQSNESRFGFLVELVACPHHPTCKCFRNEQERSLSRKVELRHVYFSQCVSCWLPVLSAELGKCLGVSGLRRKSLRVDGRNHTFYVATRVTLVLPATINSGAHSRWQPELQFQREGHPQLVVESLECPEASEGCEDETFCGSGVASDTSGRPCKRTEGPVAAGMPSRRKKKAKVVEPASTRNTIGAGFWELKAMETSEGAENGNLTSYTGIVTATFEQNLLVEMDNSVFMLLTHVKDLGMPTLRPGITLRAHNVHKVVIQNHWTSVVLLGACSRSHVTVEKFGDPNDLSCLHQPRQDTLLSKYLEHMTFTSAFWILLLVASISMKFQGFMSEEELVGTRRRTGRIQQYFVARFSAIPTVRRNAINEFFAHEQCCSLGQELPANFGLQVPPISNLLMHLTLLLNNTSSILWNTMVSSSKLGRNLNEIQAAKGRYLRRTITGSELGVIFLGCLQVSETSGKLQLVDGTGAIDVVVPDFHSVRSLHKLYEIPHYVLVVEGFHSGGVTTETGDGEEDKMPLSWSNILTRKAYGKPPLDSCRIFLHFQLKDAASVKGLRGPVGSLERPNMLTAVKQIPSTGLQSRFDVLMVTYKHPVGLLASASWGGQPQGKTFLAEAIFLPCSLVLLGNQDRSSHLIIECTSATKELRGNGRKVVVQSLDALVCFPSFPPGQRQDSEFSAVRSGMLEIERSDDGAVNIVLVEFSSESVEYYTVLRVGECYLLQHKDIQEPLSKSSKVTVGVGMHLWSLHLAVQDVANKEEAAAAMLQGSGDCGNEQVEAQVERKCKSGLSLDHVSDWMQVDVVVKLSAEGADMFRKLVSHLQTRFMPAMVLLNSISRPLVPPSSAAKRTQPNRARLSVPPTNWSFSGNLVSFRGRVEMVSLKYPDSSSLRRQWADIEVCALEGPERVKVLLGFIPDCFPAGLGPGAVVTFHRVIAHKTLPDATVCYRSTPATSAIVHNLPQLSFSCRGGQSVQGLTKREQSVGEELPMLKAVVIRGRVVRVRRLILRWQGNEFLERDLQPDVLLDPLAVTTSVYLTIDDATKNVNCWATGQVAIRLLGLGGGVGWLEPATTARKASPLRPAGSLGVDIARIVRKHSQIFVQSNSYGDAGDSWSITGAGDHQPGVGDQAILKSLVLQACHNTPWDFQCEVRVSKRKPSHSNVKGHYMYVKSADSVEHVRDLINKFYKLSTLLGL